ncbi:hypothetical protein [Treponema pedis]|uniref:Uncharacterized protein n=1 Tax=Treponema pedis str. T A4 TaxID=1291379 RepID=S5ZZN8_9SPIR|nr:hypothetical protein [Treponema pedis]AGT43783.1 hypothetical protein TPE_1288 [Treponema pedis str. T A4]
MLTERPESSYKDSLKKSAKSFAKAPYFALDIKYRIGQNSQLHSFTASQLHSFTASQLHSFTASQLHSFTASQLHSFTASQLHSFTASQLEGASCPNKQPYSKASRYKTLRTDKFQYRLLKPRPRAKSQSKTDCLFLGFFYITPVNKTARSAER